MQGLCTSQRQPLQRPGTYTSITIPKKDNYLQTYTIGVLKESTSKGAATDFENFMLSDAGQQILTGLRVPASLIHRCLSYHQPYSFLH